MGEETWPDDLAAAAEEAKRVWKPLARGDAEPLLGELRRRFDEFEPRLVNRGDPMIVALSLVRHVDRWAGGNGEVRWDVVRAELSHRVQDLASMLRAGDRDRAKLCVVAGTAEDVNELESAWLLAAGDPVTLAGVMSSMRRSGHSVEATLRGISGGFSLR